MLALDRLAAHREQSSVHQAARLRRMGLLGQLVTTAAGPRVSVGSGQLLNFASSNYLGLAGHPLVRLAICRSAEQWGVALSQPRLWATNRLTDQAERQIAQLVGQESALLFPSTSHIAQDLLPLLAGHRGVVFLDEGAYPISRVGARLAAQQGARIRLFRCNDPDHLAQQLKVQARAQDKVIVCDGLDMITGEVTHLPDLLKLAERYNAVIYLDDAQGLGLLGSCPSAAMPYGYGGGGTPRYFGVDSGRIVHVSTLAKALGVPVAFVAGPAGFIRYLSEAAFSVIHSSPPALPVLAAAHAALHVHASRGNHLRLGLLRRVRYFQQQTTQLPWPRSCHPFPMQTIWFPTYEAALVAARRLRQHGIWPVLQPYPSDELAGGTLHFILTAVHRIVDIEAVAQALSDLGAHRHH